MKPLAALGWANGIGAPLALNITDSLNASFSGPHPGVVMFVMCDAHVIALQRSVSLTTLSLLSRRADGQPIPSDFVQ